MSVVVLPGQRRIACGDPSIARATLRLLSLLPVQLR
jgi:hypothetical protein